VPRPDGRAPDALRPVTLERSANPYAEGSCLVRFGATLVLCTASVIESVPAWRRGRGRGWLTAEYAMLPRATTERTARERAGPGGRTQEIQRLVGRALRSITNLRALGERTVWLDCDVLQADGGTRTACLNAAYIALCDALRTYPFKRPLSAWPIEEPMGAISAGIVKNKALVDLDYSEDSTADVDMNVVMTGSGRYLEIQGTGESRPFAAEELQSILELCNQGIREVMEAARTAMAQPLPA
jgi:ribonuclease PH